MLGCVEWLNLLVKVHCITLQLANVSWPLFCNWFYSSIFISAVWIVPNLYCFWGQQWLLLLPNILIRNRHYCKHTINLWVYMTYSVISARNFCKLESSAVSRKVSDGYCSLLFFFCPLGWNIAILLIWFHPYSNYSLFIIDLQYLSNKYLFNSFWPRKHKNGIQLVVE